MMRLMALLLSLVCISMEPRSIVDVARGEVGKLEQGHNDGPDILPYLESTSSSPGEAWCASFVYWVHCQAGERPPGNPRAYAWSPTWLASHAVSQPEPGDVLGIYFRELGRVAHVGIVESVDDKWLTTIEGNTNRDGSREGNGVWRKRRMAKQVHGYSRWQ